MENNEKMSIVLNWLGRQATQIIKSQGVTPKTPKEIYDALEKILFLRRLCLDPTQ